MDVWRCRTGLSARNRRIFAVSLKKMNLAAIISMAGVFSTFFGFMFGSIFGFEDVIEPIWLRPMSKMTDLPMIGRLNTVFIVAVAFGMGMILLTMIIHIINAAKITVSVICALIQMELPVLYSTDCLYLPS